MSLALCCAACGQAQTTGIVFEGLPVPEVDVVAVVDAFAAYAHVPVPHGTIDFHPHSDFDKCTLANPGACPHESFGPAMPFVIVCDWLGLEHVHESSLVHELIHATFGDEGHDRADLWAYPDGILWRFNDLLAHDSK